MCEPVSLGLTIAQAAGSLYSQYTNARAQGEALARQRRFQAEELTAQAQQRMGERVRAARAARARMRVAAGEANVSGNSFEAMLSNSLLQQDLDLADINKQNTFNQRASQSRFESGLATIRQPDVIGTGLQIAGAVRDFRKSRQ